MMRFFFNTIIAYLTVITECAPVHVDLPVTDHQVFDSLVNVHFPKKQPLFDTGVFPFVSDEMEVPDDFLHRGAFYRATYKLKSGLKDELKAIRSDSTIRLKHSECCFLCSDNLNPVYRTECSLDEIPISTFSMERKQLGIDESFLGSDFELIILDADSGKFIPERNLLIDRCNSYFKHGYSRGVAYSEKQEVAIFWVNMW